jgi:hypothetical protein
MIMNAELSAVKVNVPSTVIGMKNVEQFRRRKVDVFSTIIASYHRTEQNILYLSATAEFC